MDGIAMSLEEFDRIGVAGVSLHCDLLQPLPENVLLDLCQQRGTKSPSQMIGIDPEIGDILIQGLTRRPTGDQPVQLQADGSAFSGPPRSE